MTSKKGLTVVGGRGAGKTTQISEVHDADFQEVSVEDGGELHAGPKEELDEKPNAEKKEKKQADVEDVAPGEGHNRKMGGVAADRLLDGFLRIERLKEEIKDAQTCIADIYTELQSAGFDKKACKEVIKRRQMSKAELEEQETLIDIYERAVEVEAQARSEKANPKFF